MTDAQGDVQEREVLVDQAELLYRQIALPLRNGRPTWEIFKGRKEEAWQVSVDRASLAEGLEASYLRHTDRGATSHGVLAVSVEELAQNLVEAYSAPSDENPSHCQYDLQTLTSGDPISHGQREKICSQLLEYALSNDRERHIP